MRGAKLHDLTFSAKMTDEVFTAKLNRLVLVYDYVQHYKPKQEEPYKNIFINKIPSSAFQI